MSNLLLISFQIELEEDLNQEPTLSQTNEEEEEESQVLIK